MRWGADSIEGSWNILNLRTGSIRRRSLLSLSAIALLVRIWSKDSLGISLSE